MNIFPSTESLALLQLIQKGSVIDDIKPREALLFCIDHFFEVDEFSTLLDLSLYFLLITILGGSLISNTSGIKFLRVYILLKSASSEIKKLVSPNSIINKNILNSERKITNENITISFLIFISFIISLFLLSSILVFDNISFEKSFKLSILTLTNTMTSAMYGIDDIDFANLLTSSKMSLIIFMIIGKIELISIFLIIKKIIFKD